MTLVDYFLPSAGQIINLLAVLAVLAGFAVLGGAVSGKSRFAAADVFVGWGMVTGVFVLVGVLGPVPFTWMAFAVTPLKTTRDTPRRVPEGGDTTIKLGTATGTTSKVT